MGSVPIFHNPYGQNGSSPSQIDRVVGTAYEVVREVAENLEYIKHISAHMMQVYRVSQSVDGIDFIYRYIEEISVLLDHIEEVLIVAANIDDVNAVAADLPTLDIISDNMAGLAEIYTNLDVLLAQGGSVIVSDTAPYTEVTGRMWWESDTGNLYTWFDDGTSAQWVQINIAGQTYDWLDIINKPSAFPPTAHTHTDSVKKVGDTMTGSLKIAPPVGLAALELISTVSNTNQLVGRRVGTDGIPLNRWQVVLGNTLLESGGPKGSTGSDFELRRSTNDGGLIDIPFMIPRATGIPNFVNGLTAKTPAGTVNDTTVATTAYVKGQINNFNDIVQNFVTVGGKVVINVIAPAGFDVGSVAYGNGLQSTVHAAGTTQGQYNVAVGEHSLLGLTTGDYNTAVGFQSGQKITTGRFNSAFGRAALVYLTTGSNNTALGQGALVGNSAAVGSWSNNTGVGLNALYDIKDGAANNVGVGLGVLSHPGVSTGLTGSNNTAIGVAALQNTESGSNNNAFGYLALGNITSGGNNIAIGYNSGTGITTGTGNVIIGHNVSNLAPTLNNTAILATGDGVRLLIGSASAGLAIRGTNLNSTPLIGYVGEYVEVIVNSVNSVNLGNGASVTVASITLAPGDWDVNGWIGFNCVVGSTITVVAGSLSLSPASSDFTTPGASWIDRYTPGIVTTIISANYFKGPVGHRRMSISAAEVVYLVAFCSFTGTPVGAYGKLWARRVR